MLQAWGCKKLLLLILRDSAGLPGEIITNEIIGYIYGITAAGSNVNGIRDFKSVWSNNML